MNENVNPNVNAPTVPSPIPPWCRPIVSPLTQYMTDGGVVDLGTDTTYLNQSVAGTETQNAATLGNYVITIADGNYKRQIKRIYILGSAQPTTAGWECYGTFVGCNSLQFNNASTAAVLEWDGTAWQIIGGNVQTSNTVQPY